MYSTCSCKVPVSTARINRSLWEYDLILYQEYIVLFTFVFNTRLTTTGSGSSVPSITPPILALITDDPTIIFVSLTGKNTALLYSVYPRVILLSFLSVILMTLCGSRIDATSIALLSPSPAPTINEPSV